LSGTVTLMICCKFRGLGSEPKLGLAPSVASLRPQYVRSSSHPTSHLSSSGQS